MQLASSIAATTVFLFMLHSYLTHAGGGLVLVPEDGFVNVYSFRELQRLENAHLLRLGLPMPTVTGANGAPPLLTELCHFLGATP